MGDVYPWITLYPYGVLSINRLRDTPASLGLPPVEVYRGEETIADAKANEGEKLSSRQILYQYVLTNKWVWLLAFTNIFVYFIRTAFGSWMAVYSVQVKGYSQWSGSVCYSMFELGGLCGSLTAGWASDKLFQARRSPINILFAIGMALSVLFIWWLPPGTAWLDFLAIFTIGYMVFGPQMLVGMSATEFSHKKAAATSTGFVGWFAYMGAAMAGWPLGRSRKRLAGKDFSSQHWLCLYLCLSFDALAFRRETSTPSGARTETTATRLRPVPMWVPLHVHSQYSILDALTPVKAIAKKAAEYGMPAVALTDHGNMYGAVEFFQACKVMGQAIDRL